MPLMDFLSMAGAAGGKDFPSWMNTAPFGSKFYVSYGQNLSGYLLSGRQTHILGQELKMVTDPSSWITGSSPLLTGIWSLISGAMGKTELYYGRNGGMTYVGPKFDINRTADWAVTVLKQAVATPTTGKEVTDKGKEKPAGAFGQEAVDKLAVAAAVAMGLIINGVTFGLDIAARVQYVAAPKAKETDKEGQPTDLFYLLNTLSLSLTSRLVALNEIIEVAAAWTNLGQGMLGITKVLLTVLAGAVLVASVITIIPISVALITAIVMEKDLGQGIEDGFTAIATLGS
jgi:hypothetical protein